jgi:hypothetical protein
MVECSLSHGVLGSGQGTQWRADECNSQEVARERMNEVLDIIFGSPWQARLQYQLFELNESLSGIPMAIFALVILLLTSWIVCRLLGIK